MAPCAIPLCPEKVPPIDDFFDGLVTHYALLGACSGADARCRILLDSGATASCISKNNKMLKALCTAVVDPSPNAGVKVGSAEVLNIDKVVNLCFGSDLCFDGYRVVNSRRVEERGELQCHNVLVVDGLDVDIILLSVRNLLERDGVKAYFNADNAHKVSNSLLLPNGIVIPFAADSKSYELRLAGERPARAAVADDWGARLTPLMRAHAALGHAGKTRVDLSNIVIHGKPVATIQEPSQCRACRLMHKAPVTKQSRRVPPRRGARAESTFKGERIYTDHSTTHEEGWPIKFTSIGNFIDDYTKDSDFMFTMTKSLTEVAPALREYVHKNAHLFKDGKVYYWKVDNALEYRGYLIDGPDGAATQLVVKRLFRVPHESNSNAKAERSLGVLQRGIGACLSHADAPLCLWPLAASQLRLINRCLATTAHDPPVSARDFEYPDSDPAEMGCFHVLFCNVVVALPPRNKGSKSSHTAANGCYLGYNEQRRADIVYVPSLLRIATFRVVDWCGENKFNLQVHHRQAHPGRDARHVPPDGRHARRPGDARARARPPPCPCSRSLL